MRRASTGWMGRSVGWVGARVYCARTMAESYTSYMTDRHTSRRSHSGSGRDERYIHGRSAPGAWLPRRSALRLVAAMILAAGSQHPSTSTAAARGGMLVRTCPEWSRLAAASTTPYASSTVSRRACACGARSLPRSRAAMLAASWLLASTCCQVPAKARLHNNQPVAVTERSRHARMPTGDETTTTPSITEEGGSSVTCHSGVVHVNARRGTRHGTTAPRPTNGPPALPMERRAC